MARVYDMLAAAWPPSPSAAAAAVSAVTLLQFVCVLIAQAEIERVIFLWVFLAHPVPHDTGW